MNHFSFHQNFEKQIVKTICHHLVTRADCFKGAFFFLSIQVLHPLQQRFLNLINQENFAQISQEEAVKQEIVATLEALCGIAEATQIDNVASLFSFLMDFLSSCIGLMEVSRFAFYRWD